MRFMKRYRPVYISLLVSLILILLYLYLRTTTDDSSITDMVMAICAILAAVAFWVEYHHNNKINEAQFVMELNNQFITDKKLSTVEHDLEMYYVASKKALEEQTTCMEGFSEKYNINQKEHQNLVNYLVHLEGIATMVNTGILRLNTINDLMAYRYFIAVNNPAVQELELSEYQEYYKGIFNLYPVWKKKLGKNMPLKETPLIPENEKYTSDH